MSGITFSIPYTETLSDLHTTEKEIEDIFHAIKNAPKRQSKEGLSSIVPDMIAINIKTRNLPSIINVVNNIMLAARMEGRNSTRSLFADWTRSPEEIVEIQTEELFF